MCNVTQALETSMPRLNPPQREFIRSAGVCRDRATLINRLLEAKGFSQSGLSRKYDVALTTISSAVTGQRPATEAVQLLSKVLGLPVWFFDGLPKRLTPKVENDRAA